MLALLTSHDAIHPPAPTHPPISRRTSSSSRPSVLASHSHSHSHSHRPPPPHPPIPFPTSSSSSLPTNSTITSTPSTSAVPSSNSSTHPISSSRPVDIHSYPAPDLLRLLASLLDQIARANDRLPSPATTDGHPPALSPAALSARPIWHTLTTASRVSLSTPSAPLTFHARTVPTISLHAYLMRIHKYCPAPNDVFLSLLVYFDRMARLSAEATGRGFVIDSYNVHRLVIAGVTVASKFFSDVFYTNSRYAKVGGLPQTELNQLELQFLLLNDFRLRISDAEMQHYAEQLVLFSQTNAVPPSPSSLPVTLSDPDPPPPPSPSPPQPHHPRLAHQASTQSFASVSESSYSASGTETETEGGSTDEEPTVRPAWSTASGSVAADSDEEDGEGDGEDGEDDEEDDVRMDSPSPRARVRA